MKEKISIFVIGIIFGSMLSTGSIFMFNKLNNHMNHFDQKFEMSDRNNRSFSGRPYGQIRENQNDNRIESNEENNT